MGWTPHIAEVCSGTVEIVAGVASRRSILQQARSAPTDVGGWCLDILDQPTRRVCQTVAGGSPRVSWGGDLRAAAGVVLHPGWGARLLAAARDRDWRCPRELSWHHVVGSGTPVRGAGPSDAFFRWSFSPLPWTTTGYRLTTLRVALHHRVPWKLSKLQAPTDVGGYDFLNLACAISTSERSVARFCTSSCKSSDFGVSRQPGCFLNRPSLTIWRKASFPILPLPMCSWRSTRELRSVFESFRWKARICFSPISEPTSRIAASQPLGVRMVYAQLAAAAVTPVTTMVVDRPGDGRPAGKVGRFRRVCQRSNLSRPASSSPPTKTVHSWSTRRRRLRLRPWVAPRGWRGVHSLPKAGHWASLITPRSTSPEWQSGDSYVRGTVMIVLKMSKELSW